MLSSKEVRVMKWEEYISEIELIEKQNNDEYDLYTVVANVLKERESFKTISLRCVGHRRRTRKAKEKVLWALRGFSDFVILDKQYEPVEKSTDEVNEKQAISYDKYCKKPKNVEEDREINEYLGKFDISELPCDSFILCKNANGRREWDNRVWNKLIKYLDSYSFS